MSTAVTRAYQHVHERITDGRLQPGERLFEEDIADATGVSRTPVREALRRLAGDGLVDLQGKRGAYVTVWGPDDLEVVFDLRSLLEPYAAARAATRIADEHLDRLRDLDGQMHRAADEQAWHLLAPINNAFHLAVIEVAGSERLLRPLASLIHVPLVQRPEGHDAAATREALDQHTRIVDALARRDADAAAAIMQDHLLHARRALLRSLALEGRAGALDALLATRA